MLRFIELGVNLRKAKIVRDGLYQYRKLIQATSSQALEVVIKKFIELSELRVSEAQETADKIAVDLDDDLEATESPEAILLSTVSSEQSKDRTDREVVTPWLKFLWEAYRISLDSVRNNSKLELLYQKVVNQAFDFCVKYGRKIEFRRLCEILRLHLSSASQVKNTSSGQTPIDLNDPDTLQRFLDIRFRQLNVAVELELWQEAFRSVEDVHTLLNHSKRPAKPVMMANYYENLARIFLVSGNYLFHAAAWSRYWSLMIPTRNVREEDLIRVASAFLISTLAIPTFPQSQLSLGSNASGYQEDGQSHRNTRLTNLLNLSKNPTRDSLLKQVLSKNVLNYVRPEIRSLYRILEVDFHPLRIKSRIIPIISKIADHPEYKPYFKPLYDVILTRVFQQLSQVYQTVKFDFVIDLATYPAPFDSTPVAIEKFIVRGCYKGEFNITIDHESRSISFNDEIYDESSANSSITESASSLQFTPSQIVRTQLSRLGSTLLNVINKVDDSFIEEQSKVCEEAISHALAELEKENEKTLNRIKVIEKRQHLALAEQLRREEEENKARRKKLQEEREAEAQRIAEEKARREAEQRKREENAIKEAEKRRLAEEINSKGIITIELDKIQDLDSDQIKELQVKKINEVTRELEDKLRTVGRRNDHIVRALRLEELNKWKADAPKQLEADRKFHEARYEALVATTKQDYEQRAALKKRLGRLLTHYHKLKEEVHSHRKEEFDLIKRENAKKLEEEKAKRLAEIKAKRERERELERERAEEESKRLIERNNRIREEELRRSKLAEEEKAGRSPGAYKPPTLGAAAAAVAAKPAPSPNAYRPPIGVAQVKRPPPPAPTPGAYRPPAARAGAARNVSGPAYTPPPRAVPPPERRVVSAAPPPPRPTSSSTEGSAPRANPTPGRYNVRDAINRHKSGN